VGQHQLGSDRYGTLLDADSSELERLRLLERSTDPITIAAFERIGVDRGWRCLEVGAGAGSMAGWLADRAGPASVVATDLDTQFLTGLAARGVRVLHHDITEDPPPGDAFDLIHIRHVLVHLPQRRLILAKLASWLAPGGWLVVEDAHISPELISLPAVRAARVGVTQLLADRVGSDFYTWAATLPLPLEDAGLTDAEVRATVAPVRGGTMSARLGQLGLERVSPQLIEAGILNAENIAEAHTAFADPRLLDHSHVLFCATARRPTSRRDQS
jgi:SAM-dependent methyltransferase